VGSVLVTAKRGIAATTGSFAAIQRLAIGNRFVKVRNKQHNTEEHELESPLYRLFGAIYPPKFRK
jgi:hypothetical protein